MAYKDLTPEEERVIVQCETEQPFSGDYCSNFDGGVYRCKRCSSPLYLSDHKFPCSCGWPSFDDEIPGAVSRRRDPDGHRTEIVCGKCEAHLGHVFEGEKLTLKNVRHCVNSISLDFLPYADLEKGTFAGGCFWGLQHLFRDLSGVVETTCGYSGGSVDYPTYEQVCSGRTGHLEAVEVWFNPEEIAYIDVVRYFMEIHDPTQIDGQGPDIGDQYRSAIFVADEDQEKLAKSVIDDLKSKKLSVVTEVRAEEFFWIAEVFHQHYYVKTGAVPYCHRRVSRF
nr:bifunctional methionine sulfoxide reductase B/A protein [uncultured Dethiosulfovibrio sp.]